MNATRQAGGLLFTLIILACAGFYFASSLPVIKLDEQTLSMTVDTTVTHLMVTRFDEQGQLADRLQTVEMRHIPAKNTHLLQAPHIIIARSNQAPWKIEAQKAQAIDGGKQITFSQKVIVSQVASANNRPNRLSTEELIYYPKKKLATSSLDVIFEQPGNIIHSQGMNVFLNEKHVQLLGKTQAVYEPNHL